MNVLAFLPGIRKHIVADFSRDPESVQTQSGSQTENRQDRDASVEEILLSNPAALANEFGLQWMFVTYGRY